MTLGFNEIKVKETPVGKIVTIIFKDKLKKEDYELFAPQLDKLIQSEGKIRLMVKLIDFKGWSAGAVWEDTKFGARHFNDIERLAIVGDKKWEKAMATFIKPFTGAEVRYFDLPSELGDAEQWIRKPS